MELNFRPIKHHRIYEYVVDQICSLIISGELEAGNTLPSERNLAELLGVSRASVREALRVLEFLGIVTCKPGTGTVLCESEEEPLATMLSLIIPTSDVIKDLLEIRMLLEPEIAKLAAKRGTADHFLSMQACIAKQERTVKDKESWPDDDQSLSLHVIIADACGNAVLARFMRSVNKLLGSTFARTQAAYPGRPETVLKEHKQIGKAIIDRNDTLAQAAMINHLSKIASLIEI
jgi:GntR family transcriptional repressor for pyruvate dehydrogenase complex